PCTGPWLPTAAESLGRATPPHPQDPPPAIDEADTVLSKDAPEVARRLGKGGMAARARAAIDADIPDGRGEGDVIHRGSCGIWFRRASRKAFGVAETCVIH